MGTAAASPRVPIRLAVILAVLAIAIAVFAGTVTTKTLAPPIPVCPDCFISKTVRVLSPLNLTKAMAPTFPICPDCLVSRNLRTLLR